MVIVTVDLLLKKKDPRREKEGEGERTKTKTETVPYAQGLSDVLYNTYFDTFVRCY